MTPYWITWKDGSGCCVEADSMEEIEAYCKKIRGVGPASVMSLPYPADPRIGPTTDCPSFCRSPELCAGFHACPHSRSCSG